MKDKAIRYTATIPERYVSEIKELIRAKEIPSMNYAVNEALGAFLNAQKAARYDELMKEAGQDKAFLARTLACSDDFAAVDSEVEGSW